MPRWIKSVNLNLDPSSAGIRSGWGGVKGQRILKLYGKDSKLAMHLQNLMVLVKTVDKRQTRDLFMIQDEEVSWK